jgi:hypothetical protein
VLQPGDAVQARVRRYWDAILAGQPLRSQPEHRRTVALHVRRGDYVKKGRPEEFGLLSEAYYEAALRLIKARAALDEPEAAENLVAVVFTTQESVGWCVDTLAPRLGRTAKDVVCANTSAFARDPAGNPIEDVSAASRCKGEEVDLLAMSLADFVVVANSTFSWWVHFFHRCRRSIPDWWSSGAGEPQLRSPPKTAYVFPPVWMNGELARLFSPETRGTFQTDELGGGRTMLFNFLTTDYLIPDLKLGDVFVKT